MTPHMHPPSLHGISLFLFSTSSSEGVRFALFGSTLPCPLRVPLFTKSVPRRRVGTFILLQWGTESFLGGMNQIIGHFNLAPYFCLCHKSIKSEDNLRSTTKHSKGDKTVDSTALPPSYKSWCFLWHLSSFPSTLNKGHFTREPRAMTL